MRTFHPRPEFNQTLHLYIANESSNFLVTGGILKTDHFVQSVHLLCSIPGLGINSGSAGWLIGWLVFNCTRFGRDLSI